ncbi:High-affinity branched-chain amino acid transport ATP-binding protein LivF [Pseudooceanicola marinus]|uniref:High-affinity branched-chain amino acid transport ATP-binding protein LivF n=1 Tax=Pseudooceanicola marinus TaxID=396013 RepID=A0A1X6Y501_9RHOB|nr:ABC transporter ATP-binding protein [Pseudooceanicola marinus]PJE33351.1 ABC transporter ATP-binding protein [Pseudooceanicola marinus]SLN10923.1 High-affinity branched-chain amino acid transport ATP-binding protein LivF [Pseudooceanicola marinus]
MFQIEGLTAGYGQATILREVSLQAAPGEITVLMGRNGAGKTTLMKAIMGLVRAEAGQVRLDGTDLAALPPHQVPGHGVGYVPQGRRLFSELTVAQNIEIGLGAGPKEASKRRETRDEMLELFPRLGERMGQRAGTLSGGEQQMLATARALCLRPKLLLLDEPTEGLQPSMIEAIRQVMVQMRDRGLAVLLVEQRIDAVLELADRISVIEMGRNAEDFTKPEIAPGEARLRAHLGV